MAQISLLGGAYKAPSIIAGAQRCINLFPEINPKDSKFPTTHYPTPGLTLLANAPTPGIGRGVYCDSQGNLYCVVGVNVYQVSSTFVLTQIGTVANYSTPVSMADNGLAVVIVDGSTTGYAINISLTPYNSIVTPKFAFAQIGDTNFLGGIKADFVDTFLVFNQPNASLMYCSLSNVNYINLTTAIGSVQAGNITNAGTLYTPGTYTNVNMTGGTGQHAAATIIVGGGGTVTNVTFTNNGIGYLVGDVLTAALPAGSNFQYTVSQIGVSGGAFDPLYIANKTGYPDPIVTLQVVHREIWFIGTKTCEVWYDAGAADFPFQYMPGAFIEHGCAAVYSVAASDLQVMWLSKDKQGQAIVMRGEGYQVRRISTHAMEVEFQSYSTISDAVAYTYQQQGHTFYVLSFPTANTTWVYDIATDLWAQRAYSDVNGGLNRHRGQLGAAAFGINIVQDWQTGALYKLDQNNFTDNGQSMQFIRSWPTISKDGRRVKYKEFIADLEVGTDTGVIDNTNQVTPPVVSLRWSDDGGKTWSNPVTQTIGALGQYNTSTKWTRLGQGRNRVFELSWSCPTKTALNGAWIEPELLGS